MSTIDIRNKCPKGEKSSHIAKRHRCSNDVIAYLRELYIHGNKTDYKESHHKRDKFTIHHLTYDGKDLTIAGDGSNTLISQHPDLKEISTYYHKDYDDKNDYIEKPLLLRLKNDKGGTDWYYNADTKDEKGEQDRGTTWEPNTKWNAIDGNEFFKYGKPTDKLREKLDYLTCRLHKLHYINIFKSDAKDDPYYSCPVCKNYNVTVSKYGTIGEYTKYKHTYDTYANSVRYESANLSYRDDETDPNGYKPIPLDNRHDSSLGVYYWDKDDRHTKPLVMEVGVLIGGLVPLGNDGEPNNKEWTMIPDAIGPVSEEMLHKQKCKLFSPVIIDVTRTTGENENSYPNPYYSGRNCENRDCPQNVKVTKYVNLSHINGFTAWKHTYRNRDDKTFTITGFKGGPSEGRDQVKLPIWNVNEVIVYLSRCGSVPLLVYVSSNDGNSNTHRWYQRKNGDKWEDGSSGLDQKLPNQVKSTDLERILEGINELKIECQEVKVKKEKEAHKAQPQRPQLATLQRPSSGSTGSTSEGSIGEENTIEPCGAIGEALGYGSVIAGAVGTVGLELAHNMAKEALEHITDTVIPKAADLVGKVLEHIPAVPAAEPSDRVPQVTPGNTSIESADPSHTTSEQQAIISQPVDVISIRRPNNLSGLGGEYPDVTINFDSSLVDFGYGTGLIIGGSNFYQSTEETEPILYSVEEDYRTIEHTTHGYFVDYDAYNTTGDTIYGYGSTVETYEAPPIYIPIVEINESEVITMDVSDPKKFATPTADRQEHLVGPHRHETPPATEEHQASAQQTSDTLNTGNPAAQALSTSASSTPGALSPSSPGFLHPPNPKAGSDNSTNIIKTTISVTTGILGTSALACFAGFKFYTKYKGDPWVRHGYPIEFLNNVPY
ncbi:hypothetical protein BEWA_004440 [Theileria equi strain WA]|uniref:Uncharacterized protein n=1 Tax=Theileria equi strain WA TaxID=1537102 RepID=L0B1B4_THEEQ|nr:hypothetical protein BEWA_004440 [Theileria equi strain WA]AFZ81036.1 hypothetical protein BEWA_004440 [Theileria equi strain WA]|eukprot:XP_004830702.1 hypothetical protein BEWA_004440 [Theileria equi strain WA]